MPEPEENHSQIANLLAAKFIARADVKAIQHEDGSWAPRREGFSRKDLMDHIAGRRTYGHYLLNLENKVKLMVFDIDLDKLGWLPFEYSDELGFTDFRLVGCPKTHCDLGDACDHTGPREIWQGIGSLAGGVLRRLQRRYMSLQMRMLSNKIMVAASDTLHVPVTSAYSGSKGVHVYAFCGLTDANLAQVGMNLALEATKSFESNKGTNFYKHVWNATHEDSFSCMTVETFPKQTELTGKEFGNLVRLPLGVNLKNKKHPTFFIDARTDYGVRVLHRREAVDALTAASPWAGMAPEPEGK